MSEKNTSQTIGQLERAHGLENEVKTQAEVIGGLRQVVSELRARENDNSKRVIIEKIDRRYGPMHGGIAPVASKITKLNLEDAAELIAKHTNEATEAELESVRKELASSKRDVEKLKQDALDKKAVHLRSIESVERQAREDVYQAEKQIADANTKLKHTIQDLKEELVKVKSDKTNELVEKERKEELAKLKARIKSLEREVKRLSTQGWLGKVWDRISNRQARIEAEKQVAEEKTGLFNGIRLGFVPW
jgi:DNA repair exonuclease SbcCD ATPase subunit